MQQLSLDLTRSVLAKPTRKGNAMVRTARVLIAWVSLALAAAGPATAAVMKTNIWVKPIHDALIPRN